MSARVPDRIWVPATAALALALIFVGALLVRADGDVSLLVHAGPPWTDATAARGSLTVQDADDAFDGQFFYRLGIAPWTTAEVVDGVTLDLPALRNARWGYGALAFGASGGDADLVPWALVGLNVVAAAAVGAIGGGLARASGRHAAWGVLLVLWPGFAYSLSLDTSELVAAALALGGLLALRHRRWAAAGLALTAAVLTRDTTAVIPFGVAVAGALTWRGARATGPTPAATNPGEPAGATAANDPTAGRSMFLAGFVPLVVFAAWQLVQRARFGALPITSSGDNNLSAPFGGLLSELAGSLPPTGADELFRLLSATGLLVLLIAAAWCWPRTRGLLAERAAWVPAVLVVVVLNAYLWSGATAFMRAATEAGVLSVLILLGTAGRRLLTAAALGLGGLWALTALAQLAKLG